MKLSCLLTCSLNRGEIIYVEGIWRAQYVRRGNMVGKVITDYELGENEVGKKPGENHRGAAIRAC